MQAFETLLDKIGQRVAPFDVAGWRPHGNATKEGPAR